MIDPGASFCGAPRKPVNSAQSASERQTTHRRFPLGWHYRHILSSTRKSGILRCDGRLTPSIPITATHPSRHCPTTERNRTKPTGFVSIFWMTLGLEMSIWDERYVGARLYTQQIIANVQYNLSPKESGLRETFPATASSSLLRLGHICHRLTSQ